MSKKEKVADFQSVYKRELKLENGKLIMNKRTYVPVAKEFSDEIVKAMKNDAIWEDLISMDGTDYMDEQRYRVYEACAKALNNSK